jgi:hypothetical protein
LPSTPVWVAWAWGASGLAMSLVISAFTPVGPTLWTLLGPCLALRLHRVVAT